MKLEELIEKFSDTSENQSKAIFNTLFIIANKLQTIFDQQIPEITLKQFMLLSMVHQANEPQSLTQLGELLGCSRQNVKKLALSLEQKGFIAFKTNTADSRSTMIVPTDKVTDFFDHDFVAYLQDLHYLFAVYTKEEIEQLFKLLMRLYQGVDCLKQKNNNK